jgi:hypothetical protein
LRPGALLHHDGFFEASAVVGDVRDLHVQAVVFNPLDEIAVGEPSSAGIPHDGIAADGGFELFPLDCARRYRREDTQREGDHERPELFRAALHALVSMQERSEIRTEKPGTRERN